jgi:DNA topoisomerase IA
MEREREIRAFKSHSYWIITADIKTLGGKSITLICEEEPTDKKTLDGIITTAEKGGKDDKWIISC